MPRDDLQDVRRCFVIMPFDRKPDAARGDTVDFDRVYEDLIKAAVEGLRDRDLAIECLRSDEVKQAGLIHERMLGFIYDADVAVVDLTTANPNVYYELGVRHALRDRVTVLLRRRDTKIPFNIAGMTTIEYDLEPPEALERAKAAIAEFVFNGLLSGTHDSLVHTVLPGLKVERGRPAIAEERVQTFEIPGARGRLVGIVGGNLRNVNMFGPLVGQPIDVWVNSENINMQMARPYESAVSATIRYLGAERDRTGTIVKDLVADELAKAMGRRQVVNPAEVVSTGSGALRRSHRVKRLYHVAAVYGVVGTGFHAIDGAEHCITNALARLDWETRDLDAKTQDDGEGRIEERLESILFPLLGAGTAKADVLAAARRQVEAAVSYVRTRARWTKVRRVFFLARDEMTFGCLRVAIAEKLRKLQASAAAPAPASAPPATPVRGRPGGAAKSAAVQPAKGRKTRHGTPVKAVRRASQR